MKLSIFSRLVIGYLVLLILSAGVSVYEILQLGSVRDVTSSIIAVDTGIEDIHGKLADAFLSESRYEQKFLIMKDIALYNSFRKSKEDFEQYLQNAMKLSDSPQVKASFDRIRQLHDQYLALFAEEVEHIKAGNKRDEYLNKEEKDKLSDSIIEEMKILRALNQENILAKIKSLRMAGTSARTVAMSITAASLLLGIVLAVFITRSITVPLSEMKKKTKEIAAGVFKADLEFNSPLEIAELAADFNLMSRKLRKVEKMKSDFFSLMSHELRTPLTSIKEGTNMFLEGVGGDVTKKQEKLLRIISEESNRLITLVNSLLDLSKMEAGMLAYNFTEASLAHLIQKAVNEVLPLAESRQITIHKFVDELPVMKLDPERVLQVLRNLIGNALKFTPPCGAVGISAQLKQGMVEVSVADTGAGIPKDQLKMVFDKFQQVNFPGADKSAGTGLGLAIVKHVIEKHGGAVWVESVLGKGSTFFFALPG
jgi:two-component system, NtrC family, sensor histidine kinase GlrK